jgi:hypothetical protein
MIKIKHSILVITCLVIVACQPLPNIGGGFKLEYNSMDDLGILDENKNFIIYGHILDYSFDSNFIIVIERPRDSVPECTGKIPGMTLKKSDEAFNNSTFQQFWIINKTTHSVCGPYKRIAYLIKRRELSIPEKLQFTNRHPNKGK